MMVINEYYLEKNTKLKADEFNSKKTHDCDVRLTPVDFQGSFEKCLGILDDMISAQKEPGNDDKANLGYLMCTSLHQNL